MTALTRTAIERCTGADTGAVCVSALHRGLQRRHRAGIAAAARQGGGVTGHVVLVAGPPCAGVTSLVAALGERMPEVAVVEGVAHGETVGAVVFAVSAAAPMTASDCAYLDCSHSRT